MTNELKKRFIQARRAVIAREFGRLNDMQQKAVLATQGPLLVLAGAGSGKTTVLIDRIYNILRYGKGSDSDFVPDWVIEDDVLYLEDVLAGREKADPAAIEQLCSVDAPAPWRLIAITFTNKAASELKSRLAAKLGEAANDVWAMTFHSACVRILRRDIEALGYSRSFTIYDSSDSQSVIKRICKDMQVDEKSFPPRSIMAEISSAKDRMLTPEEYLNAAAYAADIRKKQIGRVWQEYAKTLKDADALDFDDLILMTVRLLTEHEDVRRYYQEKFQYTLIDEYQDTDRLQYKLAALLSSGTNNICVVGDDDQSIYKFRGATIENILDFEEQFPGARTIRLEQNYRSTSYILNAANSVISNNQGRKGKTLWTDKQGGEQIELHTCMNEDDEANFVTKSIIAGAGNGGSFSDYAVLYRMNSQSNRLEFYFKRAGIPYKVYGGMRFYDRAEVKDMLSYLCVIANPADDLRLTRIINTPTRGIGAKTIENARAEAAAAGISMWEVISNSQKHPSIDRAGPRLKSFVDMISEIQAQVDELPLDILYDMVVEKSGYMTMLRAADTQENRTRAENVQELKSNILAYMKGAAEPSLHGFLEETALYTELDQMDESESAVTMMTIHSAKGLEFPTVFLVGMEDGIFPGMRSIGEAEEMEEERRLCYVAVTRAKEQLVMTCAQQRMLYGKTSNNLPSRFIDEMPEECLKRTGAQRRPREDYSYSSWDDDGYSDNSYSGYRSYGGSRGSYSYDRENSYSGRSSYNESRSSYGGSSYRERGGYTGSSSWRSSYGSGYSSHTNRHSTGSGTGSSASATPARPAKTASPRPTAPAASAPKTTPAVNYSVGDRVKHKAFGEGIIAKMTPAGTDQLIEVEFNGKLRKLMLKAAVPFMEKLAVSEE